MKNGEGNRSVEKGKRVGVGKMERREDGCDDIQ